jgi:hypothetical protein
VSDFLEPHHFFVPPHQDVYEKDRPVDPGGQDGVPDHPEDVLSGRRKNRRPVRDMQFLLRLAGDAASIINAEDYGRAIYDLALRRNLIRIGEDMVNIAFDAPIDMPPSTQIEDAERRLFELAETGRYEGGFQLFNDAVSLKPSKWPTRPTSAKALCRASQPALLNSTGDGRPAAFRLDRARRTSRAWARPRLPPTSPTTLRKPIRPRNRRTARSRPSQRRCRRLLLA